MTDLFAQEGITFESSHMASTAPSDKPDPITAPHIDMPDQSADTAPIVSSPMPKSAPMTQDQQNAAIKDLYGSDDSTAVTGAPASNGAAPRDLLEEQGISSPTINQINGNAFNNGISLQPPPRAAPAITPDVKPTSISDFAPPGRAAMSSPTFGQDQIDAKKFAADDYTQKLTMARQRFGDAQVEAWKNNPISFSEAMSKLKANQVVPFGGISQGIEALEIRDIALKAKNGEQLTPDDQNKLNSFIDGQLEQSIRGYSWGGKTAYVGAQIPAFAVEYAISDGFGKAV